MSKGIEESKSIEEVKDTRDNRKSKINMTKLLGSISGIKVNQNRSEKVSVYRITGKDGKKVILSSRQLVSNNISKFKETYSYFWSKLAEYGPEEFKAEVIAEFPAKYPDSDTKNVRGIKSRIEKIIWDELAFYNLNPNYVVRGSNRTGYTPLFISVVNYHKTDMQEESKVIADKAGISESEISLIVNGKKGNCQPMELISNNGNIPYCYIKTALNNTKSSEVDNNADSTEVINASNETNIKISQTPDKFIYEVKDGAISEYRVLNKKQCTLYYLDRPLNGKTILEEDKILENALLFTNREEAENMLNNQIDEFNKRISGLPTWFIKKALSKEEN